MSRDEIVRVLEAHREAFARKDVDALAATHAADGTFDSPAYGLVTGRDAIRDVYRYWYAAFPGFTFTWESALVDPPRASFLWTFKGVAAGPFFGDVKAGSPVDVTGAAEYAFAGGLIASARHVFDFSGVLVRTGVLKVKPS